MPCNSDYLRATGEEIAISQVMCLLEELEGKKIEPHYWKGHHPLVYNKTIDGNELVRKLCAKLKKVDVTKYSLEMQIWWRDHQNADLKRLETEAKAQKMEEVKAKALKKLTPRERKLLGL